MEKREKAIRLIVRSVSYVLVAALASFATMLLMGRSMKLAQLEQIIETYFVGETVCERRLYSSLRRRRNGNKY